MNPENPEAILEREFEAAAPAQGLSKDMGLSNEEKEQVEIKMAGDSIYVKMKTSNKIRRFDAYVSMPGWIAGEIRKELE